MRPKDWKQTRRRQAVRLLSRFASDFLPAGMALGRGFDQCAVRAHSSDWLDSRNAHLGSLFECPFEMGEADHGKQKVYLQGDCRHLDRLDQGKFDEIVTDTVYFRKPYCLAIAQFIDLTRASSQNVSQMVRILATQQGATGVKRIDKESASHSSF